MNPNVFTFYLTACSYISTKRLLDIPDLGIQLVTNRDIAPSFRGYLIDYKILAPYLENGDGCKTKNCKKINRIWKFKTFRDIFLYVPKTEISRKQ
jgi:hypothetical protein